MPTQAVVERSFGRFPNYLALSHSHNVVTYFELRASDLSTRIDLRIHISAVLIFKMSVPQRKKTQRERLVPLAGCTDEASAAHTPASERIPQFSLYDHCSEPEAERSSLLVSNFNNGPSSRLAHGSEDRLIKRDLRLRTERGRDSVKVHRKTRYLQHRLNVRLTLLKGEPRIISRASGLKR